MSICLSCAAHGVRPGCDNCVTVQAPSGWDRARAAAISLEKQLAAESAAAVTREMERLRGLFKK